MSNEFGNLERADKIVALPWRDAIRSRPGMYVGGTGYEALCVLIREIYNNSCDECSKTANKIVVDRDFNGLALVADNGRGISIEYSEQHPTIVSADLSISDLHTGSKFQETDLSKAKTKMPTSGQNGVGSSAVNALSADYILMSWITPLNFDKSLPQVKELWESTRSKKDLFYIVWYKKGIKFFEGAMKKKDIEKMLFSNLPSYKEIPSGMSTIVMFNPDPEIFVQPAEEAAKKGLTLNTYMNLEIENYQYFLLVAEKFLKKKVTILADGNIIDKSGFNGF